MGDATPFTKIIKAVRAHPELWSSEYAPFKNRLVQKKLWSDVATKLRIDETLLRKRWKHLKDQFRKELKKSPDPSEDTSVWAYFHHMQFLREEMLQAIRKKDQDSVNTPEPGDQNEPENSFQKIDQTSERLCRLTELVENHIHNCVEDSKRDPDTMFFMSLLPAMHRLSDIQKLQFRGKINEWLLEALTENEYGVSPSYIDSKFFVQTELADEESEKDAADRETSAGSDSSSEGSPVAAKKRKTKK